MVRRKRGGFTLVELLVVISIIGMLMALLLPAVQSARESGRQVTCKNNMANLGTAVYLYDNQLGRYPGYRDTLVTNNGDRVRVSWLIPLLPYLEKNDLYKLWKEDDTPGDFQPKFKVNPLMINGQRISPLVYWPLMKCPSDPEGAAADGSPQPTSYVVNTGLADVQATAPAGANPGFPADWPENGAFVSRWENPAQNPQPRMVETSTGYISNKDGSSNTVIISENIEAAHWFDFDSGFGGIEVLQPSGDTGPGPEQYNCFIWAAQQNTQDGNLPTTQQYRKINGQPDSTQNIVTGGTAPDVTWARPSAFHPGGCHFVFGDKHVQFINDSVDYIVLTLLQTSHGANARFPGGNTPLPQIYRVKPLPGTY